LIENAILRINPGHRYCLWGANGTGKTTLLRSIAARKIDGFPESVTSCLVSQEIPGSSLTAVQAVLQSGSNKAKLQQRVLELDSRTMNAEDQREYVALLDQIATTGDESAERARAEKILHDMGFKPRALEQTTEELSGGWRMRVALACAVFAQPDLLLLDEPTNHLDIVGIRWLQRYLTSSTLLNDICVVFVSHNRHFVDAVATDIILLAGRKLTAFTGNYTAFEAHRVEMITRAKRQQESDGKTRAALEQQLQHARAASKTKGGRSGNAVSAVKTKLERVGQLCNVRDLNTTWRTAREEFWAWGDAADVVFRTDIASLTEQNATKIAFAKPSALGVQRALVRVDNVAFNYPNDRVLFSNVSLSLTETSRIAVVGANGEGKSTFLKVLAGMLSPTRGTREQFHGARIAYFGQHREFDPMSTPLQVMRDEFPGVSDDELRKQLGSMGLGSLALHQMKSLSGGQRQRLGLAIVAKSEPHVLLLDEPTQHLDYKSIESLVVALNEFEGAIVVVTHDEWFCSALQCDTIWRAKDGQIRIVNEI